jgi:hypothetical protein
MSTMIFVELKRLTRQMARGSRAPPFGPIWIFWGGIWFGFDLLFPRGGSIWFDLICPPPVFATFGFGFGPLVWIWMPPYTLQMCALAVFREEARKALQGTKRASVTAQVLQCSPIMLLLLRVQS